MFFYFGLLFVLIIMYKLLKDKYIMKRNAFAVISFMLLLFFYTIRGVSVGFDTANYVKIFEKSLSMNIFDSYLEPLWIAYMKLLHSISSAQFIFSFGVGLIGIGAFYKGMALVSYNKGLSIIFYYLLCNWFNLMNQERSQIASCICVLSFYYLNKKNMCKQF
jgi:hypothetical protein